MEWQIIFWICLAGVLNKNISWEKIGKSFGVYHMNLKKKSTPRHFHLKFFLIETIVKFTFENIKSLVIFFDRHSILFCILFDDSN